MLFVAPELLMGNRVLRMNPREYPLDKFLRVIFRDDDGSPVHAVSVGDFLISKFIGGKLKNGLVVAGRKIDRQDDFHYNVVLFRKDFQLLRLVQLAAS